MPPILEQVVFGIIVAGLFGLWLFIRTKKTASRHLFAIGFGLVCLGAGFAPGGSSEAMGVAGLLLTVWAIIRFVVRLLILYKRRLKENALRKLK